MYLRRPDGDALSPGDEAGLLPQTLIVVEVTARTEAAGDSAEGRIIGSVVGWIPPGNASFGKAMLIGACQSVQQAAAVLASPPGKHHAKGEHS
jgi:hypothetical protein